MSLRTAERKRSIAKAAESLRKRNSGGSGSWGTSFPVLMVILTAVVIALLVINNWFVVAPVEMVQETNSQAEPASAPEGGLEQESPQLPDYTNHIATELFANTAAGYSFLYPPKWRLMEDGLISKIVNPRRNVLVSFGLGPQGKLEPAADKFVALLDRNYVDFKQTHDQSKSIGGRSSMVYKGTATNDSGLALRWSAVVLVGDYNNFAIAAFSAAKLKPEKIDPTLREVIRSFEIGS